MGPGPQVPDGGRETWTKMPLASTATEPSANSSLPRTRWRRRVWAWSRQASARRGCPSTGTGVIA